MPLPIIIPPQIDVLMDGTWKEKKDAWEVLLRCKIVIDAAIRKAWGGRQSGTRYENPEDLTHDVLMNLIARAAKKRGFTKPKDWYERKNIAPWLFTVIYHEAQSLLRAKSNQASESNEFDNDYTTIDPISKIDHDQEVQTRLIKANMPMHHHLTFLAIRAPSILTLALLQNLHRERGWSPSLHRPPEEMLPKIITWSKQYLYDPDSREARRHLAWILCTSEIREAPIWYQEEPDKAARAINLLSHWYQRAKKVWEDTCN